MRASARRLLFGVDMLNVLDVQEIELGATGQAQALEAEFQMRWNAPLIESALVAAVLEDPDQAEQLKREQPEMFNKISRSIERMKRIVSGGHHG